MAYNVWRNYDGRDVQLQPTTRREALARLSVRFLLDTSNMSNVEIQIFTLPFLSFGMFVGIGVAVSRTP